MLGPTALLTRPALRIATVGIVRLAEDGDNLNAEIPAGAYDAQRDFTTICDQYTLKHFVGA